ncbi:sulfite exporter TauE/SafE family protein [Aurantimonas sp. MSK8Z-1]|uniref:sulfite exporter TauE/SafE family protein n=1 Tax=Mangrovibrevibacter kandeliae TaxID=2968473 RepID=UPI0021174273|nr:sulfite exporter TauE/SafE family protein [Aurantimonas sp. MSK8Z-1]MCW4116344.1 sulfite exporter TauE/SafE family protein [Aurantimonas sp. MSK8Z-1]
MTVTDSVLLFVAGFLAGLVNAVAGGGTFLTFGALSLAGLPPIAANATSSIAQFPGYVTSTLAYAKDIRRYWQGALPLLVVSVVGSLLGALILLALDNPSFKRLVPWLLLAATALFAAGPWLRPKPTGGAGAEGGRQRYLSPLTQFVASIYGGFFGAGMGIMMLATLGLTEGGDYHRLNALKNTLALVIAAVAIVVFALGDVVGWVQVAVMVPAAALGGYAGVWGAKRVPQTAVRVFVIAVGLLLTAYYFAAA